MRRLPRIDRSKVRTVPARRRPSKVKRTEEARPHEAGASFSAFLDSLPAILGAEDLRAAVAATARAKRRNKTILWGFGAHLIKVGLAPVVVDLMERGLVTGLLMNGAGCVHDLELAMMGRTSEDVGPALDDGTFGMAKETTERLNGAIRAGADRKRTPCWRATGSAPISVARSPRALARRFMFIRPRRWNAIIRCLTRRWRAWITSYVMR